MLMGEKEAWGFWLKEREAAFQRSQPGLTTFLISFVFLSSPRQRLTFLQCLLPDHIFRRLGEFPAVLGGGFLVSTGDPFSFSLSFLISSQSPTVLQSKLSALSPAGILGL